MVQRKNILRWSFSVFLLAFIFNAFLFSSQVKADEVDTTAPVFQLKDVTRDENESAPSYAEFIFSNPEMLNPVCSGLESIDMNVSQPNQNKLVPVTCTVEDLSGNSTTSTANLIVNNVQSQVVIIANPSVDATEGDTINLIANITYGNPSFSYYWIGDCSGSGSRNSRGLTDSVNVSLAKGSYLCGIVVTDADGDVGGASVALNFAAKVVDPVASNTNSTPTEQENTPTTTPEETETTPAPAEVQGESTESPVSNPTSTQPVNTTSNQTTNTSSPLVIICLVAGGILIIGLLLFLFFRGEDEEEVATTQS